MRTTIITFVILGLIGLVWGGIVIFHDQGQQPLLQGYLTHDTTKIGTGVTTAGLENLLVGSTTSATLSTKNASHLSMNVLIKPSNAASNLKWTYYYSQDGTNFYAEDEDVETSQILTTHGATANVHSWTPATTATTSKRFELADVNSDFMKVTFTGAASSSKIYAEIISEQ